MHRETPWQLMRTSCYLSSVRTSTISSSTLSCSEQAEFVKLSILLFYTVPRNCVKQLTILQLHFCKIMKDHEKFVAVESIPLLLRLLFHWCFHWIIPLEINYLHPICCPKMLTTIRLFRSVTSLPSPIL